jgi:hypothetical protein
MAITRDQLLNFVWLFHDHLIFYKVDILFYTNLTTRRSRSKKSKGELREIID